MIPRRVWGIETEYGLTCASTGGEAPPLDAEETARRLFSPLVRHWRSTNAFLANGGRLYLDVGSHPEYATAECDQLADLLAQDRAGAQLLAEMARQANYELAEEGIGGEIHLFRNNVDSAGNSFGCHENYLVRRRRDYQELVGALVPYFVTRQIVVGAGHVELRGGEPRLHFSQRAQFVWDAMSSATTRSRPIVNTRDEPHADVDLYRRMHVIVGDSNVAEPPTLLKVAVTDLLLGLIESGHRFELELTDPMAGIREVSGDLTGRVSLELTDGRRLRPVDIQRHYLEAVKEGYRGLGPWHAYAVELWERALDAVDSGDHSRVDTELDWAIKARLIKQYRSREGANLPALRRLLLAYHDITDAGLQTRMEGAGLMRRLTRPEMVRTAMSVAPRTTRAHLRGRFVTAAQAQRRDHTADWMHLRLLDTATRTVLLSDPFATEDGKVDALIAHLEGQA